MLRVGGRRSPRGEGEVVDGEAVVGAGGVEVVPADPERSRRCAMLRPRDGGVERRAIGGGIAVLGAHGRRRCWGL